MGKRFQTTGIHSRTLNSSSPLNSLSQGTGLEVSRFLLFQIGIATLVGPPLSMSP